MEQIHLLHEFLTGLVDGEFQSHAHTPSFHPIVFVAGQT